MKWLLRILGFGYWKRYRSGWYGEDIHTTYLNYYTQTKTAQVYIIVEQHSHSGELRAYKIVDDKTIPLNPYYAIALLDKYNAEKLL